MRWRGVHEHGDIWRLILHIVRYTGLYPVALCLWINLKLPMDLSFEALLHT